MVDHLLRRDNVVLDGENTDASAGLAAPQLTRSVKIWQWKNNKFKKWRVLPAIVLVDDGDGVQDGAVAQFGHHEAAFAFGGCRGQDVAPDHEKSAVGHGHSYTLQLGHPEQGDDGARIRSVGLHVVAEQQGAVRRPKELFLN